MSLDPVRLSALDILVRVDEGGRLDGLLDEALDRLASDQERGFLVELVRGSLQWRERYRHVLKSCVERDLPTDPRLLAILLLSLHQLLALDGVPPYAAVHQAGELCRRRVGKRQVSFVNGVLQRVNRLVRPEGADEGPAGDRLERLRPLFADLAEDLARQLATWHSHPVWLVQGWVERFGFEQAREICRANNRPVPLGLRVLEPEDPGRVLADLAEAGWQVNVPGDDPRCLVVTRRPRQATLRETLERFGSLVVQDPAVQAATSWLLDSRRLTAENAVWSDPSLSLLDMCAAPGGKTVRLAAGWPAGQRLMAWDRNPGRIALLRDTLQRTGQTAVQVSVADGLQPPLPGGSCSAVLLDGPCSGTGVLRHHPEGRWKLVRRSPARNGRTLLELAGSAAELLALGGVLMYATCSLERVENEDVLDALLASREDLAPLADADGIWRRTWLPGRDGGDGFFAGRLQKIGSN